MTIRGVENRNADKTRCRKCLYRCKECERISEKENKVGNKTSHNENDTLCWCCANSVPTEDDKFGCEYSLYNRPVPGWEATDRIIDGHVSYHVLRCPSFVRGSSCFPKSEE